MTNEWGQPQNFVWLWSLPAAAALFGFAGWRRRARMRAFGEARLVAKLFTNLSPVRRALKRALHLCRCCSRVTLQIQGCDSRHVWRGIRGARADQVESVTEM